VEGEIKLMKNLIVVALIAAFAVIATGCKNTAKGIGRDMENTGEKIQDKVD
jgi:predicted small secreted protein